MAIAFMFQTDALDAAGYDKIMAALGEAAGGDWTPPGALAHLAGATAGGRWQVIDVWESEDAANAFYSSEAFGVVREGTAGGGLEVTPWPLHRAQIF
jgi:hypothetical protein